MVLDGIRSAHKESPGTCAGFARRESPCCLQLQLRQRVRMRLHRLDFIQATRKPYSERKPPGAFIDHASPGLPFTALCKKRQRCQSNSFQTSSCGSGSALDGAQLSSASLPARVGAAWRPSTANIDPANTA